MLQTLRELSLAFTSWRPQVLHLARNSMDASTHGTALGWFWVIVKPLMYVFCFWFALGIGLKGMRVSGLDHMSYVAWLAGGIIPWFFLHSTLVSGSRVFNKFNYLVTRLKFPVPLIPVFYELGEFMLHVMLLVVLFVIYFLAGGQLDVHLLQVLVVAILMYIFGVGFSLLTSSLSALCPDVNAMIKALSTPVFWLSGVLFDLASVDVPDVVHTAFLFNPITFFVESYRSSLINTQGVQSWIWEDPLFLGVGLAVIAVTFVAGLAAYSKLRKDIPDVL